MPMETERAAELGRRIAAGTQLSRYHKDRLDESDAAVAALQIELDRVTALDSRTAAFWEGGGNLLTGDRVTDDTLLHIARFLTAEGSGPPRPDVYPLHHQGHRRAQRQQRRGGSSSAGDAFDPGGGSAAVGGGVQRAGARLGVVSHHRELDVSDARGGGASAAAGVRLGAWLDHAV